MIRFTLARPRSACLYPLGLFTVTLLVAACGGGGGDAGNPGAGATPRSFSSGRISGFGSIIVNGVRFDDSNAEISDDEGHAMHRDDLGLGMLVDVTAGPIAHSSGSGSASEIVVHSEIKGPVEAVDAVAATLTVLGQHVIVNAATVFAGAPGGLAAIQAGQGVEIHAFLDRASGSYTAARIAREDSLTAYKLRGLVHHLDTGAKTFSIGSAHISYASIADAGLPALADGMLLKAKLSTTEQAGAWVATELRSEVHHVQEQAEAEVEGFVSDFVSLAQFKVGGITVDASGASVEFEGAAAAAIGNGVRIEVEGEASGDVLIARKVQVKKAEHEDDATEFELHGQLESIDIGAKSFVLRGVNVTFDGATLFKDGTAAGLAVGVRLEVKGRLAPGGALLEAVRISFED
jgi:Domain of unknown function (DUF5666)